MRLKWLGISALFLQFSLCLSARPLTEVIETDKYILVSHVGCGTFIERDIGDTYCPRSSQYLTRGSWPEGDWRCEDGQLQKIRMHLVRDEDGKHPPRLLYIYQQTMNINGQQGTEISYRVEPLTFPLNASDDMQPTYFDRMQTDRKLNWENRLPFKVALDSHEGMGDTIFDSGRQMLYMIIQRKNWGDDLKVFMLMNAFSANPADAVLREIIKLPLPKNYTYRNTFMEDPYDNKVYYSKWQPKGQQINVLPMRSLLQSLLDNSPGEYYTTLPTGRHLYGVSHGNIFSADIYDGTVNLHIRPRGEDVNGTSVGVGVHCPYLRTRGTAMNTVMLMVRDWDYCRLRDGEKADKENCRRETSAINSCPATLWLSIVILILFLTTCLLLLYAVWLRRNLEESAVAGDVPPIPYYPSNPPLDSTFDMSVDSPSNFATHRSRPQRKIRHSVTTLEVFLQSQDIHDSKQHL